MSKQSLQDSSSEPPSLAQQIQGSSDLRKVFTKFDANSDGKISVDELEKVFHSIGDTTPAEEALSILKEDSDGDRHVSFEEFKAWIRTDTNDEKCMGDLREAFDLYDEDKNGEITAQDLHRVLHAVVGEKATLAECENMIKGIDKNHDGVVTFDEFVTMMKRQSA